MSERKKGRDPSEKEARRKGKAEAGQDTGEDRGTQDVPQAAEETEPAPAVSRKAPSKRRRKHKKKNWLLRLLLAAGAVVVFILVANLSYFEIIETPVIGNRTISDEKILELSEIRQGDSIFFLNPWGVEWKIKKDLYISDVKVRRHLPGTVEIMVTEREAAAQFLRTGKNNKKAYIITDLDGMVMGTSSKRQKVTMVNNVSVTKAEEGDRISVKETDVYHKAMDLIATAKAGDLYFKRIDIKGSQVTAYIFDDLVVKGRYRNLIDSINGGELKSVVYRLYQEDVEKGTIHVGDNHYCSFKPKK